MPSFNALSGLRGICALLIVAGHFFTNFAPPGKDSFPSVSLDYFPPVTLFFIISGFLLGVLYQDKLGEWKQRKVFWIKRFARLAPMYYFSLIFCLPAFIAYYTELWSLITSIIFTLSFTQSFTMVGNDWSGPLWQISAFALCYLIYPFVLKPLKSKRGAIIFGVVYYVITTTLITVMVVMDLPFLGLVHTWAVVRAPHFFIGVIVGLYFPKDTKKPTNIQSADSNLESQEEEASKESRCKKWTRETLHVELTTFLLLSGFVGCLVLGTLEGPKYWWGFMLIEEFAIVPFHCVWIYYLCLVPDDRGITAPFFCSWFMEKLGDLSYSIYCMHWPLLNLYAWLKTWSIPEIQYRDRGVNMGFDTSVDGMFVLENYDLLNVLGILICVSILTHHYIENPARDWITKKFCQSLSTK